MKIFVSGKIGTKDQDPSALIKQLEDLGHEITFDWTKVDHLRPYLDNFDKSSDVAIDEVEGVMNADVVISLIHPKGIGLFVELGVALAKDIPVIAVYDGEPRSMFLCHPNVLAVKTVEDAIRSLPFIETLKQPVPTPIYPTPIYYQPYVYPTFPQITYTSTTNGTNELS